MKEKNLTIRIDEKIKESFKQICDNESTTMSNKINDFIVNEIKEKSKNDVINVIKEGVLKRLGNEEVSENYINTVINEEYNKFLEENK